MRCIPFVRTLYYIVSLHQTTTVECFDELLSKLYYIVSLHQTTTCSVFRRCSLTLYYIVSLHQTTTQLADRFGEKELYYIVSLHQTTTGLKSSQVNIRCIISFLYIKPQPSQTMAHTFVGCIISFLYIKPQHRQGARAARAVVLYRFSTSNHNFSVKRKTLHLLYYIVSLHQTTTNSSAIRRNTSCIISFLYIKPQPSYSTLFCCAGCIISFLYIKPQRG